MWTTRLAIIGVILTSCLLQLCSSDVAGPIVHTLLGSVEGVHETSDAGNTYSAFYGIKYGQAPVGIMRFKKSLPALPWFGVYKANQVIKCPQYQGPNFVGVEDCLVVNIFVPRFNPATVNPKLNVIVELHGGGLNQGSGYTYQGPHYLMDYNNTILVTCNYRLGILGFSSTEDYLIPGNDGFKDQVLCMKWVQKHISRFGGNPEKVTLMGFSGNSNVAFQYLSTKSKGLFKNAISISGSALSSVSIQKNPLNTLQRVAQIVNCPTTSKIEMVHCLKTKTAKELVDVTKVDLQIALGYPVLYSGVVEQNCIDAFICKSPYELLTTHKANKAPLIISSAMDEGLYPTQGWLNNPDTMNNLQNNWTFYCPLIFNIPETNPNQQSICDQIKIEYIDNSETFFKGLVRTITDRYSLRGVETTAKLMAQSSIVYMYRYNYTAELNPSFVKLVSSLPKMGVCHGDDVVLIYQNPSWPMNEVSQNDKDMRHYFWDVFLAFARNSVPTSTVSDVVWTPVNANGNLNYLLINGPNDMEMREEVSIANEGFWGNLLPFN